MLIKYLPNNPTGYLQPDIRDLFLKLLTKADRKIFFFPFPTQNAVT